MNKKEACVVWFVVSVVVVLLVDDVHWQGVAIISSGFAAFALLNNL